LTQTMPTGNTGGRPEMSVLGSCRGSQRIFIDSLD
jgi:hypothetical protein